MPFCGLTQCFGGEPVKLPSHRIDVRKRERVGVGAICQEDEDALVLRIDPDGCSGESIVPEAIRRQINSTR